MMSITTQMSLHGFIASAPQLNFTGNGAARFYARIGMDHFHKEPDGTFTPMESTFHDLVMFKTTAVRAYAKFRKGDQFVASGYINEYGIERDGKTVPREEFVARRIGHDTVRTRYDVDRAPSRQPSGPDAGPTPGAAPAAGPGESAPVVGI